MIIESLHEGVAMEVQGSLEKVFMIRLARRPKKKRESPILLPWLSRTLQRSFQAKYSTLFPRNACFTEA